MAHRLFYIVDSYCSYCIYCITSTLDSVVQSALQLGMKNNCCLNVRMTREEIDRLKRLADADGRSMSSLVRIAIRNTATRTGLSPGSCPPVLPCGGVPIFTPDGHDAHGDQSFATPHDATPRRDLPISVGANFSEP